MIGGRDRITYGRSCSRGNESLGSGRLVAVLGWDDGALEGFEEVKVYCRIDGLQDGQATCQTETIAKASFNESLAADIRG